MSQAHHSQRHNRGQSLVETAIFLPILILLLAGLVEVSNLLVTQNRVSTAARVATGFGAANYRGDEWDDPNTWATSMANVAKNNVTETLDLDEARWDIWAVKATLNPASTSFTEWNPQHAFGTGTVVSDAQWAVMESRIMTDVLEALDPSQVGLQVVATVAFHDRHSLLGLNAFNIGALTRVRGLSVMRTDEPIPYAGCDAFPIAVSLNNQSVYPPGEAPEGEEEFPFLEDGHYSGQNYHWPGWDDGAGPPSYDDYPNNIPGVPINPGCKGCLFLTKQASESDSSGFGWLRWIHDNSGGSNSSEALEDSIDYPGNAYIYNYPPWSDNGLGQYDLVNVSSGSISSAKDDMREHVDTDGRTLKLIVFTPTSYRSGDANGDTYGTSGSGSNLEYEIMGFVVVKVVAWYLPGNNNWLLFEFVRWDDSCSPAVASSS